MRFHRIGSFTLGIIFVATTFMGGREVSALGPISRSITSRTLTTHQPTPVPVPVPVPSTTHSLCFGSTVITQAAVDAAFQQGHPYTITTPGNYCLWSDIRRSLIGTSGFLSTNSIILISLGTTTTGTVDLDLNGWTLEDTAPNPQYGATAIYNTSLRATVHLFNGTIRGFANGMITFSPIIVESVIFDREVNLAVSSLGSYPVQIHHNQVVNSANGFAVTSNQIGPIQISNNQISLGSDAVAGFATNYSALPAVRTGIQLFQIQHATVDHNTVTLFSASTNNQAEGPQSSFVSVSTTDLAITNNTVYNARNGAAMIFSDGQNVRATSNQIYATQAFCERGITHAPVNQGMVAQDVGGLTISNNLFWRNRSPIELVGAISGSVLRNQSYLATSPVVVHNASAGGGSLNIRDNVNEEACVQ